MRREPLIIFWPTMCHIPWKGGARTSPDSTCPARLAGTSDCNPASSSVPGSRCHDGWPSFLTHVVCVMFKNTDLFFIPWLLMLCVTFKIIVLIHENSWLLSPVAIIDRRILLVCAWAHRVPRPIVVVRWRIAPEKEGSCSWTLVDCLEPNV